MPIYKFYINKKGTNYFRLGCHANRTKLEHSFASITDKQGCQAPGKCLSTVCSVAQPAITATTPALPAAGMLAQAPSNNDSMDMLLQDLALILHQCQWAMLQTNILVNLTCTVTELSSTAMIADQCNFNTASAAGTTYQCCYCSIQFWCTWSCPVMPFLAPMYSRCCWYDVKVAACSHHSSCLQHRRLHLEPPSSNRSIKAPVCNHYPSDVQRI